LLFAGQACVQWWPVQGGGMGTNYIYKILGDLPATGWGQAAGYQPRPQAGG